MGRGVSNGPLGASHCHGMGGNQQFRLNAAGELAIHSYCLLPAGKRVAINECADVAKTTLWDFDEVRAPLSSLRLLGAADRAFDP